MEIGSFSKYLKGLIVDHDKVEVPGLGIFYARLLPAHYSDNRTTIYPPYRKMYFRMEEVSEDGGRELYERISDMMIISLEQAETELNWCISRLRSELEGNKVCILPGLGQMVANSVNDFFFVPDEDLDIYPDGLGLQPVCIKINDEEKKESRRSRRKEAAKLERKAAEPKEIKEPKELQEPQKVVEKPERHVGAGRIVLWSLLGIIVLGILFLVAMYLFSDTFAPLSDNITGWIDDLLNRMLYTEEERELLGF